MNNKSAAYFTKKQELSIEEVGLRLFFPGKTLEEVKREFQEQKAHELAPALELLRAKNIKIVPVESAHISTAAVVDSLLSNRRIKGIKESSIETYMKRLPRIVSQFPYLPTEADPVIDFLTQFEGKTNRYKQTYYDLFKMIYRHAVRCFDFPFNLMDRIDRPQIIHKPIKTLNLDQVTALLKILETLTEKVVFSILVGHGWRQIENRRITAGDVRLATDRLIMCHGKEREEEAPILPETLVLLKELTPSSLRDSEPILRSRRIRNGHTEPLGEDGMSQMLARLFVRAGLGDYKGHDLRRTFASLVRDASEDEFIAMRLIRDKIQGQNDRYINFPLKRLVSLLERYSPLRQIDVEFDSPPSPP